jgi:hypothetical protein
MVFAQLRERIGNRIKLKNMQYWKSRDPEVRKLAFKSAEQTKQLKELETRLNISKGEQDKRLQEIYQELIQKINLENAQRTYEGLMKASSENPDIQKIIDEAKVGSELLRLNMYVLAHPDAQKCLEEIHYQARKTARTKRRCSIASALAISTAVLSIAGAYVAKGIYDRQRVGATLDDIENRVERRLTATTTAINSDLATRLTSEEFNNYQTQLKKSLEELETTGKSYTDEQTQNLTKQIESVQSTYTPAISSLEERLAQQSQSAKTSYNLINQRLTSEEDKSDETQIRLRDAEKEIQYLKDKTGYLLIEDEKRSQRLNNLNFTP